MRKDNYVEAQFKKLNQIVEIAMDEAADLFVAGDLFDKWNTPLGVIQQTIECLSPLHGECYTVSGNHDQRFHNPDMFNTSLGLLEATGVIDIIPQYRSFPGNVHVYAKHWGQPVPEITTEGFNILLGHNQVYEKEPPFYMPDAYSSKDYQKKYPGFDLYVLGDIHEPFWDGKVLVPGSMMRMASNQQAYEPAVWLFDIETKDMTRIILYVEADVFDMDKVEAGKKASTRQAELQEKFGDLAAAMVATGDKPDFEENLGTVLEGSSIGAKKIIEELLP